MKWFKHPKTEIRGRWLPEPYSHIFIGSDPRDGASKDWADQFDAIVNVSCTPGALFEPSKVEQRTYWYPVNEGGAWSYAYFFYMFRVLSHHHSLGHKIYVHCHAGAYRSPTIVRWWLVATQNKKLQEARDIVDGAYRERDPSGEHYSLYQSYILGNLPPRFQEFIERIKWSPEKQYVDLLWNPTRISKIPEVRCKHLWRWNTLWHHYRNKLTRPFKDIWEAFKRWRGGLIRIQVGTGCSMVASDWAKASRKRVKKVRKEIPYP